MNRPKLELFRRPGRPSSYTRTYVQLPYFLGISFSLSFLFFFYQMPIHIPIETTKVARLLLKLQQRAENWPERSDQISIRMKMKEKVSQLKLLARSSERFLD